MSTRFLRIAPKAAAGTAAVLFLLLPAAAGAQPRTGYAAAAAAEVKPLSPAQKLERRFLQVSAANLRFQAEASRLVPEHSNNVAVKELGQTLMARQKTVQPELLHLLQQRGMAMPIPNPEHTKVLKQLAKLNGARFDRLYVDEVVMRSYQADLANYEKVALQAEDPVLKGWIERQIPTLRFHMAKAGKALPAASLRGHRAV